MCSINVALVIIICTVASSNTKLCKILNKQDYTHPGKSNRHKVVSIALNISLYLYPELIEMQFNRLIISF